MIEFYYDPISPYAWLAACKLDSLQKEFNKTIVVRPVLFAGMLKAHDTKGPAEVDAKRRYTFRDVMRLASQFNLPFTGPPNHPFNPLLALRICTAIENDEQRQTLSLKLMQAAWEQGLDISSEAVVDQVLINCDIDLAWAHETVAQSDTKNALKTATQQAVELGVFGVPTFKVDNELFWGVDRIDSLRHYMRGNSIDESALENVLSREASVLRKS